MKDIHMKVEGKEMIVDYNTHFANLVLVNQSVNKAIHESYQRRGRVFVDVPQIVGITGACENIDTLFKIGNRLDIPFSLLKQANLLLSRHYNHFILYTQLFIPDEMKKKKIVDI